MERERRRCILKPLECNWNKSDAIAISSVVVPDALRCYCCCIERSSSADTAVVAVLVTGAADWLIDDI